MTQLFLRRMRLILPLPLIAAGAAGACFSGSPTTLTCVVILLAVIQFFLTRPLASSLSQLEARLAEREDALARQEAELQRCAEQNRQALEQCRQKQELLQQANAERAKLEEQLAERCLFNQQIINSVKEGIFVYDRSLRYIACNPFMEELTGMKFADLVGKHPREVFPFLKEVGVIDRLERVLAGEKVDEVQFHYRIAQTGKSGWASVSVAPFSNAQGEVIGAIETVHNITGHKKTEEQLFHAQKMEAVGELAGGIAHDFNNILTVIAGYCEILCMDPRLPDLQRETVGKIGSAADRAAQLTRGLLAFSRKQVMDPRVQDLNEIVQHVQKFLIRIIGEDIALKTICAQPHLKVRVDRGQIEQVLLNLATNARDAMPDGGMLSIETGWQEVAAVPVDADDFGAVGNYAFIAVSDTGVGMGKEIRGRIFEPFFTTKETGKGTGLGMAIVQGIVKQHGGQINVYSEPGKGTCFKIYLPLVDAELEAARESGAGIFPARGSETVLVAEDDVDIREMFVTVLSSFGYEVIPACDGPDAVAKFAANRDRIRLNILDLIMPRMNGVEVTAEIKRLHPGGVPTLYSSGYTRDIIRRRGDLAESEDIILKPVRPLELLRKVREVLDRKAEGDR